MGSNARWKRVNTAQALWLAGVIALLALLMWGFGWYREHAVLFPVQFRHADGSTSPRFQLEVADSESERAKGLMFRRAEDIPAFGGMIFIFPTQVVQTFWMKDTPAPLDMIFINQNLEVVGVISDTAPFSTAQLRVDRPSRYVIEVNAGMAKKNGIVEGARVEPLRPIPVAQ